MSGDIPEPLPRSSINVRGAAVTCGILGVAVVLVPVIVVVTFGPSAFSDLGVLAIALAAAALGIGAWCLSRLSVHVTGDAVVIGGFTGTKEVPLGSITHVLAVADEWHDHWRIAIVAAGREKYISAYEMYTKHGAILRAGHLAAVLGVPHSYVDRTLLTTLRRMGRRAGTIKGDPTGGTV